MRPALAYSTNASEQPLALPEEVSKKDAFVLAVAQLCRVKFYRVLQSGALEEIHINMETRETYGSYHHKDLDRNCQPEDFTGQKPGFVLLIDAATAGVAEYVIPLKDLIHENSQTGSYSIAYGCGNLGHPIVQAWSDADLRFVVEGTWVPPKRQALATSVFPDVHTARVHLNQMTGWVAGDEPTAIKDFWRITQLKIDNTRLEPSPVIPSAASEPAARLKDHTNDVSALLPRGDKRGQHPVSLKRWFLAGLLAFGPPAATFHYYFGLSKEGFEQFSEAISSCFPAPTTEKQSD